MSEVYQSLGTYLCFAVFDNNKQLLYSKFNFNFDAYVNDFRNNFSDAELQNKSVIFYNFLLRNKTDINKPFTVLPELTKYFTAIKPEMKAYFDDYGYSLYGFNFVALSTFVTVGSILQNEFDLIAYTDDQVSRISNFLVVDDSTDIDVFYSKYNFNFDLYSQDFRVFGSKLCIFYDFMFRMHYLSGNLIGFLGYKEVPDRFKRYFDLTQEGQIRTLNYLKTSSIMSQLDEVRKNINNIDFRQYAIFNNLGLTDLNMIKTYFIKYGQFQQDDIVLLPKMDSEIEELKKSVCTVIAGNGYGTGFLFNGTSDYEIVRGEKQLYLVTCYHIIKNQENKETVFASVYYDDNNSYKLQFRIIGYDIHTDLLIALYDPKLDYNRINYPEELFNMKNRLKTLKIIGEQDISVGQKVAVIGNIGFEDDSCYLEGIIINDTYEGSFEEKYFLSYPSTILTNIHISRGNSGSPLFVRDDKSGKLVCVGMINAMTGAYNQYSIATSSFLFSRILQNAIGSWFSLATIYANDRVSLNYFIQDIFPKKWLGVIWSYYNSQYSQQRYPQFSNFIYNGGVVVEKFIRGFNKQSQKFVYDPVEAGQESVTRIDTPLLKTKMYSKFLESGSTPIVIKSIRIFNVVSSDYNTFYVGKYDGQYPLDILTYGMMQNASAPNDAKYINRVKRIYNKILIEYFYYTGKEWILETEKVGGRSDDWYNEYTNGNNLRFYQHKFDFPQILQSFLNPFADPQNQASMMGSMMGSMNGSMMGSMNGSMMGSTNSSMIGSMNGSMIGSMDGSMMGSMIGSMIGSMMAGGNGQTASMMASRKF